MGFLANTAFAAKIKATLLLDERLDATRINADADGDKVTLTGEVPSEVQRVLAGDIARLNGAHEVVNHLTVAEGGDADLLPEPGVAVPPDGTDYVADMARGALGGVTTPAGAPPSQRAELEHAVCEALRKDPRVNEHLITINVASGVATLTGRANDIGAAQAATEVALAVPGIVAVENDLEIAPAI
jgi:osmotically-inducible protein OsmY